MSSAHESDMPLPALGGARFVASAAATAWRSGRGNVVTDEHRFQLESVDSDHHDAYSQAFDFAPELGTPLTYIYVLAQRAHVGLMLDRRFPYSAIGMVHVGNLLRWHTALQADASICVKAQVSGEPATSSGARFVTFQAQVWQADGLVASCQSRYLAKRGKQRGHTRHSSPSPAAPVGPEVLRYSLAGDDGRRYARLSGDANPIHLWRWSARLLGFQNPIIHGMHTVARVASALQRESGRAIKEIDVAFLKPIELLSVVSVHSSEGAFEVRTKETRAVTGTVKYQ